MQTCLVRNAKSANPGWVSMPYFRDRQEQSATIAALSAARIEQMSRAELLDVIGAADLPLGQNGLQYRDLATLRQIAYLARRRYQNQMTNAPR